MDDASALMSLFAGARPRQGLSYALGMIGIALVTAIGMELVDQLNLASLALLYLLPVILASAKGGLRPGLAASALSALAFNFFLVPPRFTLRVFDPDHVVTMVLLFAVAAVISNFAARLRAAADRARAEAADSAALATFGHKLANAHGAADVEAILCLQLAASFGARTALLRIDNEAIECTVASGDAPNLPDLDLAAARWAQAHGEVTGRGQATMASSEWMFAPVTAAGHQFGVVALGRGDSRSPVPPARMRVLTGIVSEAAQALARFALAAEAARIDARRESDRLRDALLSSVTHDLRTPLTVILGEIDTLEGEAAGRVREEARRLDRRIGNLLDMSRIQAGALKLALTPTDLAEAVAGAIDDMRRELEGQHLTVSMPPDLPLVHADPRLLHHILINLLDNARKFGRGTIAVAAVAAADGTLIEVRDNGPGLPEGAEELAFDRFRQLQGSDRTGGSGLGLGIVRAFAEAMGAKVSAKGSAFRIAFPVVSVVRAALAAE